MKILIAEDEPNVRALLDTIVTRLGYEVEAVSDGTEAWAVLERPNAPRFAILDWVMPGMSGPETCRKVRQRSHAPYVYIILVTGMRTVNHLDEGMVDGADDAITQACNS